MKVDKHDIELQCRWSTDRANGVRTVQRSMIHNYSEVRNMKQALIRPSKACWGTPPLFSLSVQAGGRQAAGILGCTWLSKMWWRYLPVQKRRWPSTFFGRHCSEPSPWQILFGLMSIRLNIGLIEWCLVEDAGCLWNWCCKWIACAGGAFGYGPLHTHFTYIHSHKLVAMLRCKYSLQTLAP